MDKDLLTKLRKQIKNEEQEMALDNCIGLFVTGSQLYGTNTPESDFDYEGIYIEPPDYILGVKSCDEVNFSTGNNDSRNTSQDIDCKLYSLRKYFTLAQQNNPNKVEWFFIPDNKFVFKDDKYWNLIKNHKEIFLSLKIKHSFSGYAKSQEHKLLTKKKRYEELYSFRKLLEEGISQGKKIIGDLDITEVHEHKKYHKETDTVGVHKVVRMKNNYNFIEYIKTAEDTDGIRVDNKDYNFGMPIKRIYDYVNKEVEAYGGRLEYLHKYAYDCYHKDTEFLTKRGWLKYNNILETDLLGTLDINHSLEFQKPEGRICKQYSGDMYCFEGHYTKFCVTPKHNLYVSRAHRSKSNGFSSEFKKEFENWEYADVLSILSKKKKSFSCFDISS